MSGNFKSDNYIHVPGFAIVKLGLSGNELLCYSLIYGFTQDGESEFSGSLKYVASALNVTIQNAKKIIDRLVAKGLIEKREIYVQSVKFCKYVANSKGIAETTIPPLLKQQGGIAETTKGGIIETATNNTIIDNKENTIFTSSDDDVVTRAKKSEEKQCLFSSLEIAKDVKAGLAGEWYELFQKYTDDGIDIMAYFDAVYNWSDMKSVKRTRRGWIATIHEWIKRDRESGRLKMIAGTKTASERAFEEAAAEYLKEGGFYK